MNRPSWRLGCGLLVAALGAMVLAGCAAEPPVTRSTVPAGVGSATSASPGATSSGATSRATSVPQAREGRPARSSRVRFVPERLTLPGGADAEVLPAATVNGELKVPERVQHVGWWDGGAYAGDPFGSTVIAGHIDSATDGLGFFARLREVRVGDRIRLSGDGHSARYRVVSVQVVAKGALSSDSRAFDQTGDHRLVLITCGGAYHRDRGGYDSNLVVTGVPVGRAR